MKLIALRIIAVILILYFFTPFPGGMLALATGLTLLICTSLPFALFVQSCRRRSAKIDKGFRWIEDKLGEKWARGIMYTRSDADPREHIIKSKTS